MTACVQRAKRQHDGMLPMRRALTTAPLYFIPAVSPWAMETASNTICEQGTLLDRLTDPKDWIIGLVVGVVGGLVAIVLLSFRVPKLKISRYIRKPHAGKRAHAIQVINKRKSWWLFTGDAIDIRAELHVVTDYEEGNEHVTNIKGLVRHDPLIISHRHRFGRLPKLSEYIFDVNEPNLEDKMKRAVALLSVCTKNLYQLNSCPATAIALLVRRRFREK
jgi:hypothetical protein